MKTTKAIITICLISFFLNSCSKENETDEKVGNNFPGHYRVASITSDIAVDLNNDGVKSIDLYQEIKSPNLKKWLSVYFC